MEVLDSFSNNVASIGPLFNDTRIEVAKSCYALDDKVSYQSVGGIKPVVPSGPLDTSARNEFKKRSLFRISIRILKMLGG